MRAGAIVAVGWCVVGLAGCGGRAAPPPPASPLSPAAAAPGALPPAAARRLAAAPPPLSTAPGSCSAVVARTLGTVARRIEARAALHRRAAGRAPTLVAALTAGTPAVCAPTAAGTVAGTVAVVGERLVRAEATGPEVGRALGLVARDPAFVRAIRRRDRAALRAAIVRLFRIRRLHIVRVRATTAGGRLVGDVGGPYVLAPASRAIRGRGGRAIGRVTLSVQDDTGFIKLMRRFTGAGVLLRTRAGIVPGSSPAPPSARARVVVAADGRRFAVAAFTARAFPAGPLRVAVLVPITPAPPR